MSLYNKLRDYTTNHDYSNLNTLYTVGAGYKQSTVERGMRDVVKDTGIKPYWGYQILSVTAKNENGVEYIIGYKRVLEKDFNLKIL